MVGNAEVTLEEKDIVKLSLEESEDDVVMRERVEVVRDRCRLRDGSVGVVKGARFC